MNPISKKFISLFLVFSLLMLYVNLYAKEKRGAKLIIYRKSEKLEKPRLEGTPWEKPPKTAISGELIAVKDNSLILLDTERRDVSVDIVDIEKIVIEKKRKLEYGIGELIGGIAGATIGVNIVHNKEDYQWQYIGSEITVGLFGWFIGTIIGAFIVAIAVGDLGKGETIQIAGMTDSEIQETLDKLRKKARIRDYK